ncbi:MAG TPA: DUF998 domain-containing protein [Gemmatimonadaceae bacterium]|nr:DUF998 domain-containing protein [Gemmatimonadaceae bacterium]
MTSVSLAEGHVTIALPTSTPGTRREVLLVCGLVSSLLYVAMNVVSPLVWREYSSVSQTVSELSAIGAPTRAIWLPMAFLYTALVTVFGWGVREAAGSSRALRAVGDLVMVYGLLGLVWPFAPMHLRPALAAGGGMMTDTIHIALGIVTVLLMLLAIGFGATAFGRRFRVYSIATLVVLVVFGALTAVEAPAIGSNQPTPLIGVWERTNIAAFLLWVIVLSCMLLLGRRARPRATQSADTPCVQSRPREGASARHVGG